MQFRASIPEGYKPGTIVPVKCSGVVVHVQLPKGKKAGDSFLFAVSRDAWQTAKASGSIVAFDPSSSNSNNSNHKSSTRIKATKPLTSQVVRRRRSFWSPNLGACCRPFFLCCGDENDEEEPLSDLCKVLLLGLAFSLSVMAGFVFGILSVTSADDLIIGHQTFTQTSPNDVVGMTIQNAHQTTVIRQNPDGTTTVQQTSIVPGETTPHVTTTTLPVGQGMEAAGVRIENTASPPGQPQQIHLVAEGRPEL